MQLPGIAETLFDPDQFGCSGKAALGLTRKLSRTANTDLMLDYSIVSEQPLMVTSIDRVNRCSSDWGTFACIAVVHVLNDILVSGARALQAMICFNFARQTDPATMQAAVGAFADELHRRGISIGKCHTSINDELDSVIISIVGVCPDEGDDHADAHSTFPRSGFVYLSRPLGHFKLHYLREMGFDPALPSQVDAMDSDWLGQVDRSAWTRLSDVSGHGIASTLIGLAATVGADIEVELSPELAADPKVLEAPMPCFLNWIGDYPAEILRCDEEAWPLAGLMETAGPIVGLSMQAEIDGAIRIGRFSAGAGLVTIGWSLAGAAAID